jgi:hypothetical protein
MPRDYTTVDAGLEPPSRMENKHVGYVFLVDANRKIRWAGCSWATVDEEEVRRLLRRRNRLAQRREKH